MANSARDPLWQAVVSAEVSEFPERRAEIEAKCLKCHAPMASEVGLVEHGTGSLMHTLACEAGVGDLGRDGVSCTICHGISPRGLGTPSSFSAGFRLDGQRMFGPHKEPFLNPMRNFTGFSPTYGGHILESALCGTCHTLETQTLDAEGKEVGSLFLEQSPYFEWRNSEFQNEEGERGPLARSCQSCHLPTRDSRGDKIAAKIARSPIGKDFPRLIEREPYGRHLLVGGNTLVLSILRDHAQELRVAAPAAAFDATIEATRDQLQNRSARISVVDVERDAERVRFAVDVVNLTGHKLPTGHPTRRVWLRVVVRDAEGTVLFASGSCDEEGHIVDGEGNVLKSERLGGPIEPHRDRVSRSEEVATYQAVMADHDGRPTHTLLRGAGWYVDDRLLPRGWNDEGPHAERTAPVGVDEDANFVGGSDRVHYDLPLETSGPVTVEASLLYQSLSARWAAELFAYDTPEVLRFRRMYVAADRTPEVLDTDTVTAP